MATLKDGEALYRQRHPVSNAPAGDDDTGPVVRLPNASAQPHGLASGEALYHRRGHRLAGRLVIEGREPEPTDVTPGAPPEGDAA
jgi:hypothetical protein